MDKVRVYRRRCFVKGCKVKPTDKNLSFHHFPRNEELRLQWINVIGCSRSEVDKVKSPCVCSKHFQKSDYPIGCNKRKLHNKAVPSLNLPGNEENRDIKMKEIKENPNIVTTWPLPFIKTEIDYEDEQMDTQLHSTIDIKPDIYNINEDQPSRIAWAALEQYKKEKESEIKDLKARIVTLTEEVNDLRQQLDKQVLETKLANESPFSIITFQENDKKILFYTGFESFKRFKLLYEYILSVDEAETSIFFNEHFTACKKMSATLSPLNQFFLSMVRLRRGANYQTLANMFGLSKSNTGRIFQRWINLMFIQLGRLSLWAPRNVLLDNAPLAFKARYPKAIGSIICIEFIVDKLLSVLEQSKSKPSQKVNTSRKSLILVDPNGKILYMSPLFDGSTSDKKLMVDGGFVDVLRCKVDNNDLKSDDVILADKAFNVSELVDNLDRININIPKFSITGMKFTIAEMQWIEKEGEERKHVLQAIKKMKQFKVLTGKQPITIMGSMEKIFVVCCILTTYQNIDIRDDCKITNLGWDTCSD